jgi:hypothetical protein
MEEDGSFFILSGNKLWYSSKKNNEQNLPKTKAVKNTTKVRNAAKNKRVIEYQIFEDIMKNQSDPYWISFFDECAVGKLPRGFKFINNVLYYRIKSKTLETLIPEEPLEAEILIKKFIFEHAGIISPKDLNERREAEEFKANNNNTENTLWSSIKNEREQSILISSFVERVSECFNLSKENSQNLTQVIKLSIYSGFLGNENIILENGAISEIIGLEYNDYDKKFLINEELRKNIRNIKKVIVEDNDNKTVQDDNDQLNNRKCLIKHWNKYITELNSKKLKY